MAAGEKKKRENALRPEQFLSSTTTAETKKRPKQSFGHRQKTEEAVCKIKKKKKTVRVGGGEDADQECERSKWLKRPEAGEKNTGRVPQGVRTTSTGFLHSRKGSRGHGKLQGDRKETDKKFPGTSKQGGEWDGSRKQCHKRTLKPKKLGTTALLKKEKRGIQQQKKKKSKIVDFVIRVSREGTFGLHHLQARPAGSRPREKTRRPRGQRRSSEGGKAGDVDSSRGRKGRGTLGTQNRWRKLRKGNGENPHRLESVCVSLAKKGGYQKGSRAHKGRLQKRKRHGVGGREQPVSKVTRFSRDRGKKNRKCRRGNQPKKRLCLVWCKPANMGDKSHRGPRPEKGKK